jgi:sigma-B regulation protein RsbU (phosphoserine phosphatase)
MTRSQPIRQRNPASDLLPLFEFSNVVNSSIDLNFILSTVLLTVMGKMLVSKGAVLLKREESTFEIVAAKGIPATLVGSSVTLKKMIRTLSAVREEKEGDGYHRMLNEMSLVLSAPIISQGQVVGMLALGEKIGKKKYATPDKELIKSLLNLSASAIEKAMMLQQLKTANRNRDKKIQELNTLFELSKEFNLVLDGQKVLRLLTFSLLGQIGVNRYAICLLEDGVMKIMMSRIEELPEVLKSIRMMSELKNPMLTQEMRKVKNYAIGAEQLESVGVRAVVPMQVQNTTKGLILLGERLHGGAYGKADLEFVYSLGNLAIISVENARLFRETLEKQRLEDELRLAREIQQGLLPQTLPEIPGLDISAVNVSSKQVGGDYYDFVQRSDQEYVVAIGDVSGKGAPAALLMANVQAALRALAPMDYTLPEATARMNDLTFMNTGGDKFITFFWGVIDSKTKRLRYVNAGHNPPFLMRANGAVERLTVGGLILGVMKTKMPYEESEVTLSQGDTLFLFTDGVSEAMNEKEEDFTEERLERILREVSGKSASEIVRHVKTAVEIYEGNAPQSDDITMMAINVV